MPLYPIGATGIVVPIPKNPDVSQCAPSVSPTVPALSNSSLPEVPPVIGVVFTVIPVEIVQVLSADKS